MWQTWQTPEVTYSRLYADMLKKEAFTDTALLSNYKEDDFHRMYVMEIEQAYIK